MFPSNRTVPNRGRRAAAPRPAAAQAARGSSAPAAAQASTSGARGGGSRISAVSASQRRAAAATGTVNLLTFLRDQGSDEDREIFANDWTWYLRQALLQDFWRPTFWFSNVQFELRSHLRNVDRTVRDWSKPAEYSVESFDRFVDRFGDVYAQWKARHLADTPSSLVSDGGGSASLLPPILSRGPTIADPYQFPMDSVIYGDWKNVSTASTFVNGAMDTLELESRKLSLENDRLVSGIDRLNRLSYVQRQFIQKFHLAVAAGDGPSAVAS